MALGEILTELRIFAKAVAPITWQFTVAFYIFGFYKDPILRVFALGQHRSLALLRGHSGAWLSQDAARREAGPDFKGTRTWMLVPRIDLDAMVIVPLTSLTRSSMLVRPKPLLCLAASVSKPLPESLIVSWTSFDSSESCTSILLTPLCFAALWKASCRIRNKVRPISDGIALDTSALKLICIL